MHIGWPQGIVIANFVLSFGVALAMHGAPKHNWNAGIAFFDICLSAFVLWWGGFFG